MDPLCGGALHKILFMGDLFPPIHRDVRVANNFKCVRAPDVLVVCPNGAFAYALAQSAQFVGVQFILNILLHGIFLQLSVFEGLSCFFIKYSWSEKLHLRYYLEILCSETGYLDYWGTIRFCLLFYYILSKHKCL